MQDELLSAFVMALSSRLKPEHTRWDKPVDWEVTTTARTVETGARDERRGVSRIIQGDGRGWGKRWKKRRKGVEDRWQGLGGHGELESKRTRAEDGGEEKKDFEGRMWSINRNDDELRKKDKIGMKEERGSENAEGH